MAEYSNVAAQTVAVNGNVLFNDTPTSVCNKGIITHRTGSGLIAQPAILKTLLFQSVTAGVASGPSYQATMI